MIKNLLFDLGGVIMDIEKERCIRAFEQLGLPDANSYFGDYVQQPPFSSLEEGLIGPDEFRSEIRARLTDKRVSDSDIDAAFQQFLIGIPVARLRALRKLRSHYGVYLLSNTNSIMWDDFIARQFRQEGADISAYFDGTVTSFEAVSLKPSAAIFRFTEQKLGIKPEETLFLDDSSANCAAAVRLGWHAAHVCPGREFVDILAEQNLLPGAM